MNSDEERLFRLAATTGALVAELDRVQPTGQPRSALLAGYRRVLSQLVPLLPAGAREELARLHLPDSIQPLTGAELRIAHAQLLGWLQALHLQLAQNLTGPSVSAPTAGVHRPLAAA